jgi:hypothetical protein
VQLYKKVLEKAHKDRTLVELQVMRMVISKIKFFANQKISEQDWDEILKCLTYESVTAGDNVF